MVIAVTSLTGNGLKDWFLQRVTALILVGYVLFLLAYFVGHPALEYTQWQSFFKSHAMQLFSILAMAALLFHAWVGMWTVLTDYISCPLMRISLQIGVIIALIAEFIWAILIIGGQ